MTKLIGSHIYHKAICPVSSMDWAKEQFDYAPHGSLFLADYYEQARGRQGRTWELYPGQLIFTFILKPHFVLCDDPTVVLTYLTMALTVGLAQPLRPYGIHIKWPNDFILEHKKMGGILAELIWHGGQAKGMVVGCAFNVNTMFEPDDQLYSQATSLKQSLHHHMSCDVLQENMISCLNWWYECWHKTEFNTIYNRWKFYQGYKDKRISIHRTDGTRVVGVAREFCANGNLILQPDDTSSFEEIPFYTVESISH